MITYNPTSSMWHKNPATWHGITQTSIVITPNLVVEAKIHILWYFRSVTFDSFQWNITVKTSFILMCPRHYLWTPNDAVFPQLSGHSLPYHGTLPGLPSFCDNILNWIFIMEIWIRYVVVNTIRFHSFHQFCAFLTLILWRIESQMIRVTNSQKTSLYASPASECLTMG